MLIGWLAPGILSLAGTRTGELALTQTPDTTGIYKDRSDSLDATVFVGRQNGNYLSRGKELRTEVISSAGQTRHLQTRSLAGKQSVPLRKLSHQHGLGKNISQS